MKKVTIRTIARLAGVSPAAVSFALNGKKGISDETRKHILDIAARESYNPPSTFHADDETMRIAVVLHDYLANLDNQFYTELYACILRRLCDDSHTTLLTATARINEQDEVVFSNGLRSPDLDGILVFGDFDRRIQAELNKLPAPSVILDSSRCDKEAAVRVDYENAAYIATRHLIELGHTDIAYLGHDRMHDFNLLTYNGFQRATAEANLSLRTNRIQFSVYDEHALKECIIDYALKGPTRPTALFCASDCYAIRAIRHLHTLGLSVPKDISVIGIDDTMLSQHMFPSLTSVHVDREQICELGVSILEKRIAGEPWESVTLPLTELIIRESTAAPQG